jgi:hypothetical protein
MVLDDWSATLTLPDYGRVARHPSTIDGKRGYHFLQPDKSGLVDPTHDDSLRRILYGMA